MAKWTAGKRGTTVPNRINSNQSRPLLNVMIKAPTDKPDQGQMIGRQKCNVPSAYKQISCEIFRNETKLNIRPQIFVSLIFETKQKIKKKQKIEKTKNRKNKRSKKQKIKKIEKQKIEKTNRSKETKPSSRLFIRATYKDAGSLSRIPLSRMHLCRIC